MAVDLISYSVVDDDGTAANIPIFLPTGQTLAALQTFSDSMAAAIDDITACKIIGATISKALTLPGTLKANPVGGHFVQLGANFGFAAAGTPYRHTVRIPGILETLLTGDVVNTSDTDVSTFVSAMTGGFGGEQPSNRYTDDLTALLSAVATFRK